MPKPEAPKTPVALKRQVKKLELLRNYAEVHGALREHRLREHRANLQNELIRLQTTANQITPGLRDHMAQRAAQVRALNRMLNK